MTKKIRLHALTLLSQQYAAREVARLFERQHVTSLPFWVTQDIEISTDGDKKSVAITGYVGEAPGTSNPLVFWVNMVCWFKKSGGTWVIERIRVNERNSRDVAWLMNFGFRTTDVFPESCSDIPLIPIPLAA
jgi:hypothetical protein